MTKSVALKSDKVSASLGKLEMHVISTPQTYCIRNSQSESSNLGFEEPSRDSDTLSSLRITELVNL